eukprot:753915-Hanusia_phi.AAC.13
MRAGHCRRVLVRSEFLVQGQISIPSQVEAWRMIDCGYAHTCGIDVNGSAYCWGWDGITTGRLIPFGQTKVGPKDPPAKLLNEVKVPSDITEWRSIAAGRWRGKMLGFEREQTGATTAGGYSRRRMTALQQISLPAYLESAASQLTNLNLSTHFAIQEPSRCAVEILLDDMKQELQVGGDYGFVLSFVRTYCEQEYHVSACSSLPMA